MALLGRRFDDAIEALFFRLTGVRPLGGDPQALWAVGPGRHLGRAVTLADGTIVRPGDPILEVHFRRQALFPIFEQVEPARFALAVAKLLKREMPLLDAYLDRDPRLAAVKAIHAITPFHEVAPHFGFEVHPLPTRLSRWWYTTWQRGIVRRTHPLGAARLAGRNPLTSQQVWMSRARLRALWGPEGTLTRRWRLVHPAAAEPGEAPRP